MSGLPVFVIQAVRRVVDLLAQGDLAAVVRLSNGTRLTEDELRDAVATYGRKLIPIPPSGEKLMNIVRVTGSDPSKFMVDVPLWTLEEGRSDLTLSLTVTSTDSPSGYTVEIDDLHVL